MTLSSPPEGHLVVFSYTGWGHNRGPCNLVVRLVQARPIYVTYLTSTTLFARVENEIRRSFEPGQAHLFELIRDLIVAVSDEGRHSLTRTPNEAAFTAAYARLVDKLPLTCCHTGVQHAAVPNPRVVLVDIALDGPLGVVRRLSKEPVKVLALTANSASCTLAIMSPQLAIPPRGVEEETLRTGRQPGEVVEMMLENLGGAELNIPGLPTIYDHEILPQQIPGPLKSLFGPAFIWTTENLSGSDGNLVLSVECLEKTCIDTLRSLYANSSRSVHVCGPLVPLGEHAIAGEQSPDSIAVTEFLDKALETHGHNSLIYMSFGSWLWPSAPEMLWAFLDVLLELNIPFIMSHASHLAIIPDAVIEKVKASKLGLLTRWAPQQTILAHSATGWMVTHAGQNSFLEALTHGVPMICWPFIGDQPYIALHASTTLDVAYELFEVRSGPGRGLVYRLGRAPEGTVDAVRREARDVLARAFGEDGQKKRENVLRLQEEMAHAWDADGSSTRELHGLLDLITGA